MVSDWIPSFLCFRAPPGLEGSRSPLRSGRCKANVHRTFCSLCSTPVVVKRMSAGHSTTSRALTSKGIQFRYHFVFVIPPWLEGSRSPLRSGRCETNVHWTFRSLRSTPVVVKRMSAGHSAVSAPLRSLQSERPQDVLQSPLRFGRCKANVHWTFCNVSRSKRNMKKQRKYTENLACFRYKDKNFAEKDKMLCFLSRL